MIGGGAAYWAGWIQANETRTASNLQVGTANAQLAHLKTEKEEDDQRANRDLIIALHAEAARVQLLARLKYETVKRRHSAATNIVVTQAQAYAITVTSAFREGRGISNLRGSKAIQNFIHLLNTVDQLNAVIEVKGLLLAELQGKELLDVLQKVADQAGELQESLSTAIL